MIRTCVLSNNDKLSYDIPITEINPKTTKWYWVDFVNPTKEETDLLTSFFYFHPLSVEDCIDSFIQRPKVDFYESYIFLVLHAIHPESLKTYEVDMFLGEQYIVTFQQSPIRDLNNLWESIRKNESFRKGPLFIMHSVIDKLVDEYFPPVYRIEDQLNSIEDNTENETVQMLIDNLFNIRADLSKLRRTVIPMSEMVYQLIKSEWLGDLKEHKLYFNDVYDHLLKIVEMIESYRDFSSDIRDSYLSVNSNTMNSIMMTLTVITTIFMPLTFIAGIYGMNFENMPELHWTFGYFIILGFMGIVAIIMFFYFQSKGWFKLGRVRERRKRSIKIR